MFSCDFLHHSVILRFPAFAAKSTGHPLLQRNVVASNAAEKRGVRLCAHALKTAMGLGPQRDAERKMRRRSARLGKPCAGHAAKLAKARLTFDE
jgi:hypothetical protein